MNETDNGTVAKSEDSAIEALIERLDRATGPDWSIDAEIDALLRIGAPGLPEWAWKNFPKWKANYPSEGRVEAGGHWASQRFTGSVDVAIALAERVLPECDNGIDNIKPTAFGRVWPCGFADEAFIGEGATPAIALCIAILKAVQHQEPKP